MSTPEEEAVLSEAERIARMAMGNIDVEGYQSLLFRISGMMVIFRQIMSSAGYSNYFIESAAWMMMTSFYGQHLTNKEIRFDAAKSIPEGGASHDQG